ncbi:FimV/HubP family polar landmark protein [Agaribacterium sp. ZY112]|uniref:FimV/HubP family polar landmark protein n=1 Tax=Agaribacterium sp. ZY112 TaxID=3233574 RepID=UPI00352374EC
MGRRIASYILASATVLGSAGVNALGLGDISLKSHLNQRLDAEIELLEVRKLAEEEVLIKLASQADYDRLGVERSFHLSAIKFDVDLNAPGGPVVKLVTDGPVREPFLDFVLEARWPSGKLLREYTVLLDLPVYTDQSPAIISNAQSQVVEVTAEKAEEPTTRYNPRSNYGAPTAAAPVESYEPSIAGGQYKVQNSDTLWEIALASRPDSSVSVHQTMMALHRANPQAFIDGNINLLKTGQILRIPERDEIVGVNRSSAVQEVAAHNQAWRGDTAAPLEASTRSLSSSSSEEPGTGRLSLSAPDDSFDVEAGRLSGSAESSSDSAALEQELSAAKEALDMAQGENQELRGKIDSLEEQIETLEKLIKVSSETLRAMELSAEEQAQEEEVGEALDARQTDLVEELEAEVEAEQAAELEAPVIDGAELEAAVSEAVEAEEESGLDAVQPVKEEVAEAAPSKKPTPKPVVSTSSAESSSIVDMLMGYIAYILAGIAALIAAIVFFLRQRGKDDFDDAEDDFDDDFNVDLEFDEAEDEVDPEFESAEDGLDITEPEPVEDEQEVEQPEAETEDVVAESDIYIAYGKYEQAEEMLLKALDKDPAHHDARLKLLEIYAAQNNADAFVPNLAELSKNGASEGLISRAEALREGVEGLESVSADEVEDDGAALDFDLSIGQDQDDTLLDISPADELLDIEGPDDTSEQGSEFDLDDLDLDLDLDTALDNETESGAEDLSLDLNDFDLETDEVEVLDNSADSELESTDLDEELAEDFDLDLGDLEVPDESMEFDLSELDTLESEQVADDKTVVLGNIAEESSSLSDDLEADLDALDLELGSGEPASEPVDLQGEESDLDALSELEAELDTEEPAIETLDSALDELDLDEFDQELDELAGELPDLEGELDAGLDLEQPEELDALLDEAPDLAEIDLEEGLDVEASAEPVEPFDIDAESPLPVAEEEPELTELGETEVADDLEPVAVDLESSNEENLDFELPDLEGSEDEDEALDFLSDSDEIATKLDLAGAYIDMGDMVGAKDIVEEILSEGNDEQKAEAQKLLERIAE